MTDDRDTVESEALRNAPSMKPGERITVDGLFYAHVFECVSPGYPAPFGQFGRVGTEVKKVSRRRYCAA